MHGGLHFNNGDVDLPYDNVASFGDTVKCKITYVIIKKFPVTHCVTKKNNYK